MDMLNLVKAIGGCFLGKKVTYNLDRRKDAAGGGRRLFPDGTSIKQMCMMTGPGVHIDLNESDYLEVRFPSGLTKGGGAPRFRIIVGRWSSEDPRLRKFPKILKMFPGDTNPEEIIAYLRGDGKRELFMVLFSL